MKKIVYCSETGHTKRYAEMLGESLGIEVYNIKELNKINKNDDKYD